MPNRLEKTPLLIGPSAGGGGAGGGSGGSGGGSLPPQGTSCFQSLSAKVAELWPWHIIEFVQSDRGGAFFRVSDYGAGYVWRVTGSCENGYLVINYQLIQSPPGYGSDV